MKGVPARSRGLERDDLYGPFQPKAGCDDVTHAMTLGQAGSPGRVRTGALSCCASVQRSQPEPLAPKQKLCGADRDLHKPENISPSSPPPGEISKDLVTRNLTAHSSWQLLASSDNSSPCCQMENLLHHQQPVQGLGWGGTEPWQPQAAPAGFDGIPRPCPAPRTAYHGAGARCCSRGAGCCWVA